MSLRRHLNNEGIRHADADSLTHARHVRERRQIAAVSWIADEVTEENPAVEFRLRADGLGLGQGAYWTGFGDGEKSASGEAFQGHCNAVNWSRRWNYAMMTRGGKKCKVRRIRKVPSCEEFVVNLAPWQMRYINGELARWEAAGIAPEKRKEMLTAMVDDLRREVVAEFQRATGRDVLGSYIHFDSNKIHVGVIHSRVGPDNELVGDKCLGTVGPWSTSQNRLSKLGLVDPGDRRLAENLERFHARFGEDRKPLDIRLHDVLDQRFAEMVAEMGDDSGKRYKEAIEYYKDWKQKTRREAAFRSAGSQRIAWQALRLVTPLLPPQVRTALAIARTAMQAFRVVGVALDAVSSSSSSATAPNLKQPELAKIL